MNNDNDKYSNLDDSENGISGEYSFVYNKSNESVSNVKQRNKKRHPFIRILAIILICLIAGGAVGFGTFKLLQLKKGNSIIIKDNSGDVEQDKKENDVIRKKIKSDDIY